MRKLSLQKMNFQVRQVTKKNGNFIFSSRDNKALLRAINKYVDSSKMVRSLSFFDVVKRGIKNIFKKNC